MILKRESIPRLLVLTVLTLGISLIPWAWRISKQTRRALEATHIPVEESPTTVTWISIITFGFYWFYTMGDRLAKLTQLIEGDDRKFPWGVVHLIVVLSGHPLASVVLMQMDVNRLADAPMLKALDETDDCTDRLQSARPSSESTEANGVSRLD